MNPLKRLARVSTDIVMLVNGQRRVSDKTRQALVPSNLRTQLVEAAQRATERGLVVANLSEISARLASGRLVINRQAAWLADLSASDFAVLAAGSDRPMLDLAPSRHVAWHRLIYDVTEAAAALFCQPNAALLAATLNRPPSPDVLPDAAEIVGDLVVVEAEEPELKAALEGRRALLVRGYGLLVWGPSPTDVVGLAETANAWCRAALALEGSPESKPPGGEGSADSRRDGILLASEQLPHTRSR